MYFVICIVQGLICGFIAKSIAESRGMEGGFLWGFFLSVIGIIVVAVRPNDKAESSYQSSSYSYGSNQPSSSIVGNSSASHKDEWTCLCGRVNASYVGTCVCGKSKSDVFYIREKNAEIAKQKEKEANEAANFDNIKKLKELLDMGAITQEEFEEKKKQYL